MDTTGLYHGHGLRSEFSVSRSPVGPAFTMVATVCQKGGAALGGIGQGWPRSWATVWVPHLRGGFDPMLQDLTGRTGRDS